jgi:hypothetical protein
MSGFTQGERVWTFRPRLILTTCPTCGQEWQRNVWEPGDKPYYIDGNVIPAPDTQEPAYFLCDENGYVISFSVSRWIFHTHEEMMEAYEKLPEKERVRLQEVPDES